MAMRSKGKSYNGGALSSKARRLDEVEILQDIEKAIGIDADFPDAHCLPLVKCIYDELLAFGIYNFDYARRESWCFAIDKLRSKMSDDKNKLFKAEVKKLRSEGMRKSQAEAAVAASEVKPDLRDIDTLKYPIPAFLLEPKKLSEEEDRLGHQDQPQYSVIKTLFFMALINNADDYDFSYISIVLRRSLVEPCVTYEKLAYSFPSIGGHSCYFNMEEFISKHLNEERFQVSAFYQAVTKLAGLVSIKPAAAEESTRRSDEQPQSLVKHEEYDEVSNGSTPSVSTLKHAPVHAPDLGFDATAESEVFSEEDADVLNRSWEARYQRITPNRYARLTPVERRQLVDVLKKFLRSQNRVEADSAAVVLLMYVTGMPLNDLLATQTGDQGDFSADGTYRRSLMLPSQAYEPPPELATHYEAYQDRIELQLPAMVLPWLRERINHQCETLLACLGGDEELVRKSVELIMERIREAGRFPRIRAERISAALAVELAIKHHDPTVIFFLSGKPNHVAPVLSYYVAHSVDELVYKYSQAVQNLLALPVSCPTVTSNAPRRSGYFPTAETIHRLREGLMEQFRLVLARKDDIVSRHNAFINYCLALLFVSTGHRPVHDPFASLRHFDLDRGLLLINDKAADQTRAWRLVALPGMAVSQMREYLDYLPKLAAHLQQEYPGSSLPQRILRMTQGEEGMLPLFFLLNANGVGTHVSITRAKLSMQWSEFWPLPVNALRHIMATQLLNATNRADYVQLQLGHMTGADYPLGQKASESALKILSQVGCFLDTVLRELGWGVVEHRMRLPSSGAVRGRGDSLPSIMLGPALRQAEWAEKQSNAGELVKEVVAEQPLRTGKIRQSEFETLLQRVDWAAAERGYAAERCRRLLYQYVRRQRGGKELLRKAGRALQLVKVEPSPFTEETLEKYRSLASLRRAFLDYLDQRGRRESRPTEVERLVEIVCSAALFGGMANSSRLKMLGHALQKSTYQYSGRLFVDIPMDADEQVTAVARWFPDKISSDLIEGYYKIRNPERAPGAVPERAMRKLLSLIGSPGENPLDRLAANSRAGLVLEAPGYVVATAIGDINGISLPLSAWMRVESGQALQGTTKAPEVSQALKWAPDLEGSAALWSSDASKAFLRQLKGIVSRAKNTSPSGNKKVSLQQKEKLIELLKSAIRESLDWPALPKLLAGWAVHLCQNGTSHTPSLAYSTIEKYLLMVANRLCPAAVELGDFLALDEESLEQLYLSVVEREPKRGRFELARLLHELHSYMDDMYLLGDLDWSEVMAAAGGKETAYANANYITSAEYRRALEIVLHDTSLSDNQRWQCAGLLIWGYRFGLRFGEAFRLQYQDIQREGDELYLWIRNTQHGDVKTTASKRVAYLLEVLTDREKKTLDILLSTAKADFEEDQLIPLMRRSAGSRELQSRYWVAQYLGRLLKGMTGDESVRYHHLRHGFVTRQVGALAGVSVPGFNVEALKPWVRQGYMNDKAGYPLRSVSVGVGHASEVTTLESYTHCMDLIASKYYPDINNIPVTDFVLSYAEQVSPSTPRRRRARGGTSGWRVPIPCPDVKTREPAEVSRGLDGWKPSLPELPEVDRLLRRFSATGQTIDVAIQLELDPATAHAIVERAAKVEALSGYRGYCLAERSVDPVVRAALATVGAEKIYKNETTRMQVLLEKLATQLEDMTPDAKREFFAGVEVWLQSTSRAQGRVGASSARRVCLVAGFGELCALVNMADKLGVSATILVEPGYDVQLLEGLSAPVDVRQKPTWIRAGSVGVELRSPPEIGSARSLRRLLFLLATAGGILC